MMQIRNRRTIIKWNKNKVSLDVERDLHCEQTITRFIGHTVCFAFTTPSLGPRSPQRGHWFSQRSNKSATLYASHVYMISNCIPYLLLSIWVTHIFLILQCLQCSSQLLIFSRLLLCFSISVRRKAMEVATTIKTGACIVVLISLCFSRQVLSALVHLYHYRICPFSIQWSFSCSILYSLT